MTTPPLPHFVSGHVPPVRQILLPDLRRFRLADPAAYVWRHEGTVYRLVVPIGFEHDFASVPRLFWSLISPLDLGVATIFHDWLYATSGHVETEVWAEGTWTRVLTPWTRHQADCLFGRQMREQGVARWRRRAAYLAVRLVSGSLWERSRGRPFAP